MSNPTKHLCHRILRLTRYTHSVQLKVYNTHVAYSSAAHLQCSSNLARATSLANTFVFMSVSAYPCPGSAGMMVCYGKSTTLTPSLGKSTCRPCHSIMIKPPTGNPQMAVWVWVVAMGVRMLA